jgi:hypothetical protein
MNCSVFLLLCAVGGWAIFSSAIAKNLVLPILAQQLGATPATIEAMPAVMLRLRKPHTLPKSSP